MSSFEKHRFEIWNPTQHPYKHTLTDFAYSNDSIPWITTLEGAMNSLFAVNYPNTMPPVATPADLPTGVDTPNVGDVTPALLDYRIVLDDGDTKAAGYRYEQREGEVLATWHKIYDLDWGEASVVSNLLTKTNDTYVSKYGQDDIDSAGDLLVGDLSGQYIYGGASANTHLTLYANSGDGVGADTGFVQLGDQVRALIDATYDLGTATKRFKDIRLSGDMYLSAITVVSDLLTSSTGTFNFDNDNITTTGTIQGTAILSESFSEMKQIVTPTNPAVGYDRLYFKSDDKLYKLDTAGVEKLVGLEFTSTNDNRLIKSSGVTGEAIEESGITVSDVDAITGVTALDVDGINLDGTTISVTTLNDNLNLLSNGTGKVTVPNLLITGSAANAVYTPDAEGILIPTGVLVTADAITGVTALDVDNIKIDANTISSTDVNGDISLAPNGTGKIEVANIKPDGDNTRDIGEAALRVKDVFMAGNLADGTNTFPVTEVMKLRDASIGATSGDALFFDGSKWVASAPDSEIDHGVVSGLLDDDHTQYTLLAGRASGQTIIGGSAASENLTLESTSDVTKGSIVVKDNVKPLTDNTVDLGTGAARLKDIYQSGQLVGSRLQNVTTATRPASSAANTGRVVYNSDTKQIELDTGIKWTSEGVNKHVADIAFDGIVLTKDVDVSADVVDARNCSVQLLNNNNDFDRIYCTLKAISATTIRIVTNTPLLAGSYRLIVIE